MGDNVPAQAAASITAMLTSFVLTWMPLFQFASLIVSILAGICAVIVAWPKICAILKRFRKDAR